MKHDSKHLAKPKYSQQDGQELPKPIGFEVDEEVTKLPSSLATYFVVPGAQGLVTVFLQEYYKVSQHFVQLLYECYSFKKVFHKNMQGFKKTKNESK